MSKMTNVSSVTRFKDDDYKNKEIDRWEKVYTGCIILRDDYETEEELETDWDKFSQMPHSLQLVSDDKAQVLYGMTNEEKYFDIKKKFLKQNLKPDNTFIYRPSSLQELKEHQFNESTLLESVKNSNDTIYKCIMMESIIDNESISKDTKINIINEASKGIQEAIIITIKGFFLPEEMEHIGTSFSEEPEFSNRTPKNLIDSILNDKNAHKDMYMNYKAATLGITPALGKQQFSDDYSKSIYLLMNRLDPFSDTIFPKETINETKQMILDLGWNPYIPFNENTQYKRLQDKINEEVGYNFINLTCLQEEWISTIPKQKEDNSYFINIIYMDKVEDKLKTPTVVIGNSDELFWQFDKYYFVRKFDMNEFKSNFSNRIIEVHTLPVSYDILTKLSNILNYMSTNRCKFGYNYLYNIMQFIGDGIDIYNRKLFSVYLFNLLLVLSKQNIYSPSWIYIYPALRVYNNITPNIFITYRGYLNELKKEYLSPSRLQLPNAIRFNEMLTPIEEDEILIEENVISKKPDKAEEWNIINGLLN